MADTKISALPASTLPLAGTEVLPIVQSGATKKVATDDLTVKNVRSNATNGILQIAGPAAAATRVMTTPDANFTAARIDASQSFTGDQTLGTGNLVIGTAGKGIDFSINPAAPGATSELLDDYEIGTWTPSIGGTATYTTQTGRYTKVGRLVTFMGDLTINVQGTGNAGAISGLPFAAAGNNPVYVGYYQNLGQAVSSISPFIGGTDVLLYGLLVAASTATNLTIMTNGARLMFQGSYEV